MFDRWLVFTDMDGTLLNHHDYRVEAALPMLQKLEQMDVPVVFNTSKTFAELKSLVQQLHNRHPFIIENGSAIAVPDNYFSLEFQQQFMAQARTVSGYRLVVAGSEIAAINSFLKKTSPDAINFNECSQLQAIQLTGLTASETRDAQKRQYSVPLVFSDSDEELNFIQQAKQAGFSILKGGRFTHILGSCDKGSSMLILKNLYEKFYRKKFGLIALGDNHNDVDMLQQCDIPIVVNSPSSVRLKLNRPDTIYTRKSAPEGWVEGLQSAFKRLNIF